MQQQLIQLGYLATGEDDGKFGNTTRDAVRAFQRQNGLVEDGKVGAATVGKLFPAEGGAAPQRSTGPALMGPRQTAEVQRNQEEAQRGAAAAQGALEQREAAAAQEFLRARPTEGVSNMTPRQRRDTLQRLPEIRGRLTEAQRNGPVGAELSRLEDALRQRDLHPSGLPRYVRRQ